MSSEISVIISTHNPRQDYLTRVLAALKTQTLQKEKWELLVIDNASHTPVAPKYDLAWHPHGRHIWEDKLGLAQARLRGMKEACGASLLFVDDDNLLNEEYMSRATEILNEMPWLGAIGGQIVPEYEVPPPEWLPPHDRVLSIRRADRPRWSNAVDDWQSQPWGAGMVLRKSVCDRYRLNVAKAPIRQELGRKGSSLISGEDVDMVLTSLDLGLGFGVFPDMVVTHLIPQQRMTEDYICRISRGLVASNLWLAHLRGDSINLPPKRTLYTEVRRLYHYLKRSRLSRRLDAAAQAGVKDYQDLMMK